MQTLRTSSIPRFTGDVGSSLTHAEAGFPGLCSDTTTASSVRSSLSIVSARENVAWREFDVNCMDASPSRPAPPLPCCSTSDASCISLLNIDEKRERRRGKEIEVEMEMERGGEEVNDMNDITALSNLSDEIQKVEARLATIRMEEAALCTSQRNALQGSSVSRTVNNSTMMHNSTKPITTTTAIPPERAKRESYMGGRNYLNRTNLMEETTYNSSLIPPMAAKERLCEPTPMVVSVVAEPSDAVFSLATFLQPIRTVDIEVSPGLYEKLQIFADDDMEDVAKRFIRKHNLNEQRALKPLYTFLVSLLSKEKEKEQEEEKKNNNNNKKSEQDIRACSSEISYPVENTNITAPNCSMGRVNNVQSVIIEKSRKSSISNVKISRDKGLEDYSMNPKKKQQQQQNQPIRDIAKENIQKFSPTDNTKPAVKNMLNCSGVKEKSRFSCKSNEGSVHRHSNERNEPKQDGRRSTPLGRRSNSPRFIRRNSSSSNSGNSNSKAHQEYRYVDPHTKIRNIERTKLEPSSLLQSSQPPHVVTVEVQSNRENVQKHSKSTLKGEKINYGSKRPSRCSSVEGRRTVSSTRQIQSLYDVEEPLPTFKPTLAPRSEKLVAKDPQRCQTPTYVRLHAQTMKRMSDQNKTTTTTTIKPSSTSRVGVKEKDDYSGKPRILSRSQDKISQEPVGNRLYEQAIEQQRRLEEKRLKEQQKREEEEWRSILAVPQINKEKKRRSCDMDKDQTNSIHLHNTSVPSRSLLLLQQRHNNSIKEKVKPHEERELEACTFVPSVNPASLRMFNMVVRGQIAESAGMMSSREDSRSNNNNNNNDDEDNNDNNNNKHREGLSVEERLLLHEEKRRKRLEDERHFREQFDAATGRPLFRPFLGR